ADRLRDDRDRSEEQGDIGRGRMVVKDDRDQADGEHDAGCYSPPQLEPHGVERYLLAEALSLPVTTVQIVGNDRKEGAEHELKHGPAPSAALNRPRLLPGRGSCYRPSWLRPRFPAAPQPPALSRPSRRPKGP